MLVPHDIFGAILANRQILTPADITAIMLTCKQFHDCTTKYLTNSAMWAEGYPKCKSLIKAFTCKCCGYIGWNALSRCVCSVVCRKCKRNISERLTIKMKSNHYCAFSCATECEFCMAPINKGNFGDFTYSYGILRCKKHTIPFSENESTYYSSNVLRCISRGQVGLYAGPIPWSIIAEYDPDNPILTFAPIAI